MIKNFIALMALMMGVASCSASSAKSESAAAADSIAIDNTVLPDTALMVTKDIPAGSKMVEVETTMGNFTILLYGDTPGHRDNFLKHVGNHAYDSVLFHRVINDFMVQTGDPDSKNAAPGKMLGSGSIGDQIPAEIVFPRHFHKRGALAAARTGDQMNPERKSSGSQFYVVTGKTYTDAQLDQMNLSMRNRIAQGHFNQLARQHEAEIRKMQAERDTTGLRTLQEQLVEQTEKWLDEANPGMTAEMREAYKKIGGTPHLDNEYTVFGEVISGMDTIDKIQKAETDRNDRPVNDIRVLSMKVLDD